MATYVMDKFDYGGNTYKIDYSRIPFGKVDSTSTPTAFTVTIDGITELVSGVCAFIMNGQVTSKSGCTLKVNDFDPKPIYCTTDDNTRVTTHWNVNYTWLFVYNEERVSGGCWDAYWGYDTNSNTYDRTYITGAIHCGSTAIVAGNIIVGKDGAYHHLKSGDPFDITYPILYANAAIAANGNSGNNTYLIIPFTITTTQNMTLTTNKPVYIKGTLQGNIFTPISEEPLTQVVPSQVDEFEYMLLGYAVSSTVMYLIPEHPIYKAEYPRRDSDEIRFVQTNGIDALHYRFIKVSKPGSITSFSPTILHDTLNIVSGDNIELNADLSNSKITVSATNLVPTSRKVAGHALSADVTISKSDVGLENVDNTADADKTVGSAASLSHYVYFEGLRSSLNQSFETINNYAVCYSEGNESIKVACLENVGSIDHGTTFTVAKGARAIVKFNNTNTVTPSNLTLVVTAVFTVGVGGKPIGSYNTGDNKPIKYRGENLPSAGTLAANHIYEFIYDGTNWQLVGDLDTNTGGGGETTVLDSTIPYVQLDSTSTSTAFTATISGITELKDGLTILVKNGRVTSASGVTFKLNNFDALPIYYSTGATSRVTTHWNSAYTWLLTYDSTRVSGGCWLAYWGYDSNSNDTSAGYIRENHGTYTPTTNLYRYMICLQKNETQVVPLNTSSNNTGTGKTLTTEQFNPFGRIFYYSTTGKVTEGNNISVSYFWTAYSNINYRYSFNTGDTLTPDKDIYLKAKLVQSDGLPMRTMAVLADDPIVQQLPLYEDDYIYIKLGHADTTTNGTLTYDHPIYVNRGGQIMLYQDHYNDWNTFKGYSRTERDWFQFANYDSPGINGLFEVKTSEDTSLSGTPPYSGYYPMLSMQRGFVAMQFAGSSVSGDLYWRGRQSGAGDLANIAWRKVIDSGTGVTTGTITSSHTINYQHLVKDALGNVSMYLQLTLTSAVSQWAQLAIIPSGFHPVHTMRILGLNGTTAIPAALNKSGQNSGSVQIGAAASSGAVIYITAHYNVN